MQQQPVFSKQSFLSLPRMKIYNWLIAPLLYIVLLVGCRTVDSEETKIEYTLRIRSTDKKVKEPQKFGDHYIANVGDALIISAQAKSPKANNIRWHVCKEYNLSRKHFGAKESAQRERALHEAGEERKKELEIDLDGIAIDKPWEMIVENKHYPDLVLKCGPHNEKALSINARLSNVTYSIKVMGIVQEEKPEQPKGEQN
ncbi:MAG: hypothetical protein AAF963_01240 [Bacteroidota bacterium]